MGVLSRYRADSPVIARAGVPRVNKSVALFGVMLFIAGYIVLPLTWLVVNSTKTQKSLFSSFGLWFSGEFALIDNIQAVLSYNDGVFVRWLGNTALYVVVGAGGATSSPH